MERRLGTGLGGAWGRIAAARERTPPHSHRRTQWRRRTGHLCPGNREVRQRGRGHSRVARRYDHAGVIALHGESFSGPFRESERNIAEGQPDVLLRPGIPWGSTWSARAYVDCFNRDNRYSVTTHAANTGCPTLYIFGAEESAVGGPQEIPVVGAARRGLEAVGYSHAQICVIDGANHGYIGREENLLYTMFNWLSGL